MNTLHLELWELPHHSPAPLRGALYGQMDIQWQGKQRRAGVRVVTVKKRFSIVFVCDLDEPQLGNWVICRRIGDGFWLQSAPHPSYEKDYYLNSYLPGSIHDDRAILGRFCVWGARRCAVIAESGEGSWQTFTGSTFTAHAFKIKNFDSPLWLNSSRATRDLIQRHWEQDPDVRFAYKWSQMGYVQKMACWFGQDLEELRYLMKLVLLVLSLNHPLDTSCLWSIGVKSSDSSDIEFYSNNQKLPIQKHWLQELQTHLTEVLTHPQQKELQSHPCVQKFLRDNRSFWALRIEHSTFHERMEARFLLREWLNQKSHQYQHKQNWSTLIQALDELAS